MTSIITPIHVAPLGSAKLRFFKAPTTEPNLCWHVHDDLAACLGLPRDLRRHFRHALANGPFKSDIRTVACVDGLLTIAPHYAAQGLIGAAIQIGRVSSDFETAYATAAAEAFQTITAGWPKVAAMEHMMIAARNTLGRPS